MLPTCLVGSYPQPEWLIDRAKLSKQVPRVRARDLWLVGEEHLQAAQDNATLLAIRDQERAGLDIISDGENAPGELFQSLRHRARWPRSSINPGHAIEPHAAAPSPVPRIVGQIRRDASRWRCATSRFCGPQYRPTRSRSRCRGRSP